MPHVTDVLYRGNARGPHHLKKFTNYLKNSHSTRVTSTMFLRNSILDTRTKINGGQCMGDMQLLINCLKMNEFQENSCLKEFAKHRDCVQKEKAMMAKQREILTSEDLGISKRLNSKQINKLLKMYPSPSPRFVFTHSNNHKLKEPEIIKYDKDEPFVPKVTTKKGS